MFDIPRSFVLHNLPIAFSQYLEEQAGNISFLPQLGQRREKCLEIDHNSLGLRKASESLPINPQPKI